MKSIIHKSILVVLYSAILVALVRWAFQGPSDVELRIRASEPIALDPLRSHSK